MDKAPSAAPRVAIWAWLIIAIFAATVVACGGGSEKRRNPLDAAADLPTVTGQGGTGVVSDGGGGGGGTGGADAGTPGAAEGQPCTTGTACASGFCADGVCCKTACTGACQSCSAQGAGGACVPAAP